ncbi:MAG TPA: FG-GAP-like repeat-containing protein [Terriglobales bacterium]|nr:FG-GAP-like repeat-containing protein [Terriglobales bacterium]
MSLFLLLLAATAAAAGQSFGCFGAPTSYGTGSNPRAIVLGDFNNDGKLDMATAGFGNSVCIFLGNGDGTFQNAHCYGSGLEAFTSNSMAVADFNKDGNLDLVIASDNTNSVAVLLGKGDGTFPAQVNYAVGTQPFGVAAGDLGNGSPDIVVGNSNGSNISVLVNKGDGTFNAAVTYAVHAAPFSIAIADMNKDGKNDVIVGDTTGSFGNIDLLLSNGDGTLQNATSVVGMPPYLSNIVVADFNNDGNLDVAANTFNVNGYLSVALGNGDGTFQPAVSMASPLSYALATADLNGDGKLDLVLANSVNNVSDPSANKFSVYRGQGDGTFTHVADYMTSSASYNIAPEGIAIGDLNGDGHPDIAQVNQNSGTAQIFLNSICSIYHFAMSGPTSSTAGVQFNETLSIVEGFGNINTGYTGTVHFTSNDAAAVLPADSTLTNGTRTFPITLKTAGNQTITATDTVSSSITGSATVTVTPAAAAMFFVSIPARRTPGAAFDIAMQVYDPFQNTATGYRGTVHFTSSDGRASLPADYTFTSGDAGRHVFRNAATLLAQGTQTVTARDTVNNSITSTRSILIGPEAACFPSAPTYTADSNPYAIAGGDFRHIGKTDVAVVNINSGDVSVFLSNGDGSFQPAVNYPVGRTPVAIGVGDFNGDGKLDIVTANLTDTNLSVLLGNGDGTFQAAKNTPLAAFSNPRGLAVGDFNGDGKLDVAVSLSANPYQSVRIMGGNGDGTFSAGWTTPVGGLPEFVIAGDFNGDGALDFAVADYSSNIITVALNSGSGSFPNDPSHIHTYTVGSAPSSIAVGDFNRDGKADLVVTNFNDNTISVLRGNGNGTFQNAVNYPVGVNPTSVISGDFDGDGFADLAVANSDPFSFNPGTVGILLGDGAGNFQGQQTFTVGLQPFSLVAADFNGDSITDFAVANENSAGNGNVSVSLNQVCPVTHLGITAPASTIVGEPFTFGVSALNVYNRVFSGYTGTDVFGTFGSGQFPFPYTFGLADNGTHQFPNGAIFFSAGQQYIISHESPNNSIFGVSQAITVSQASTTATLALTSGTTPSNYGQPLTFTATVSPQFSGTPTGTVTFFDGANSLGTGTPAGAGTWTFSTSALTPGSHTITASYGGDANFQSSPISSGLTQDVNRTPTNVVIAVSPIPFRFRQSVTFTATVTPSNSAPSAPTGSVTFRDGATVVCAASVDVSGHAACQTNQFAMGLHVITAVYAGDTNFAGNNSPSVTFYRSAKPH